MVRAKASTNQSATTMATTTPIPSRVGRNRRRGNGGRAQALLGINASVARPNRRSVSPYACYTARPNRTDDLKRRAVRIYSPSSTIDTLERLLADPAIEPAVVTHRVLPAREALTVP